MRPWQVVKTDRGYVITPTREFNCPFCKTSLKLHQFIVLYYPKKQFYHADVHLKCPECGFFTTFGVPITEWEYNKLIKSELLGTVLTDELLDMDISGEDKKKIEERLKSWGYW